ncbi:MAG: 50S ribosomal protein L9 [Deltaproteobacteria bacterium]|nr:50S ribosomal protein L9 [Deltaproteobacteria bacterium]
MEVILKEDIGTLGQAGDIVKVADGYGRNYLVPRGLAVEVSRRNIRMIEEQKKQILRKTERERKKAEDFATRLSEVVCTIARKVGEQDKLFGSVNTRDIEENLTAQGITVDRKHIVLEEPLRELGEFPVTVKLSAGVTAEIKVVVVAEN